MPERILFVGKGNAMGADIFRALRALGHRCSFFDQRGGITYSDIMRKAMRVAPVLARVRGWDDRRMNERLTAEARRFRPTILLVWNGDAITPDTVRTISALGARTVNWFLDLMTHWDIIRRIAPDYDFFFTPDRRVIDALRDIGIRGHPAPFAYARAFDRYPELPRPYPISFVGSYHPDIWRRREEFLATVADLGVHVWGPPAWKKSRLRNCYRGEARGAKMMDIYRQSLLVIDVPWDHVAASTVSIRPFEATAAGACLLYYDIRPDIHELFVPGREYVPFSTAEELRERVLFLLGHAEDRESIARAGYIRFMRDHTYEARLSRMIETIREIA